MKVEKSFYRWSNQPNTQRGGSTDNSSSVEARRDGGSEIGRKETEREGEWKEEMWCNPGHQSFIANKYIYCCYSLFVPDFHHAEGSDRRWRAASTEKSSAVQSVYITHTNFNRLRDSLQADRAVLQNGFASLEQISSSFTTAINIIISHQIRVRTSKEREMTVVRTQRISRACACGDGPASHLRKVSTFIREPTEFITLQLSEMSW